MININIASHYLGGKLILEDIALTIPDGRILGLIGRNGSGKSTLLRLMSGVYRPDRGTILYDGKSVALSSLRSELFFLPDDPYYAGQSNGAEIFETYRAFYPSLDRELYRELLGRFKLDEQAHQRNFSKGMRRQFYIALALSARPKYLLLDEAFDGLDAFTKKAVIDELNRAVEETGSTVIISSHALSELETFCDSYAMLEGGTIASHGTLDELAQKYCRFKLAFTEAPESTIFSHLNVRDIKQSGKFVTITLEGDPQKLYESVLALNPTVIDREDMSLEDAFITDINGGTR